MRTSIRERPTVARASFVDGIARLPSAEWCRELASLVASFVPSPFARTEPFAIFVNFVLLPSMLRRKIKMLVDPTELVRFPYQTTLHEHPTTYLAHQARHASSTGR